ncbi:hypothetical protein [Chryseobacterium sp. EO14]|uniref:hypothetical protein n=1 Tax=Chryseobacterium sp. EO14 TaxID=2950551 RepID=UPI002108CD80|nr:hypothetical protein [Chryseobacterium sp. EO14]MCQ4142370.1 hypothetical protein [Chryseobacterium sp. EO14]
MEKIFIKSLDQSLYIMKLFKHIEKKKFRKNQQFWIAIKKTNNLKIISNDKIEKWILPHLSKGKRGFSTKFGLVKIIQMIIKRLKTGCQWR